MIGVRPATGGDAEAIADVQRQAWQTAYADLLPHLPPPTSLAAAWRAAADGPPSPRHRLLVALNGATVAGFAAYAPSDDRDLAPATDAELLALHVRPAVARQGHGSRLLAACVDLMRRDGFGTALAWVLAEDVALGRLLLSAGWAPDGARRALDVAGRPVAQLRLHTDLGGTG